MAKLAGLREVTFGRLTTTKVAGGQDFRLSALGCEDVRRCRSQSGRSPAPECNLVRALLPPSTGGRARVYWNSSTMSERRVFLLERRRRPTSQPVLWSSRVRRPERGRGNNTYRRRYGYGDVRTGDDLDEFIAQRTSMNPEFPQLVNAAIETRRLVRELATERERQGLSQEKVAVALGTKQRNVARLERGAVDPKHTTLVRYAALLGRRIALEPMEQQEKRRRAREVSRADGVSRGTNQVPNLSPDQAPATAGPRRARR